MDSSSGFGSDGIDYFALFRLAFTMTPLLSEISLADSVNSPVHSSIGTLSPRAPRGNTEYGNTEWWILNTEWGTGTDTRIFHSVFGIRYSVFLSEGQAPSYSKQLESYVKYEAIVKLSGSFCPAVSRPHLHSHFNFAESLLKTVAEWLRLSCGPLIKRLGISLP